jgi:peptide/nickel transport system ATP-binding protein
MTVGEQVRDTLAAHENLSLPQIRLRALELMRMVRVDSVHLNSYPHQLSGGMRQRVVIAIALAWEPALLIMDEPTTALDVLVERKILTEVLQLQKSLGFSILFITHDIALLLEFADKIAVLKAGEIVEIGETHSLGKDTSNPYTQRLISSIPSASGPRDPTLLPQNPPKGPQAPILRLEKVNKWFPLGSAGFKRQSLHAVNDFSLTIHKREIVALVGESGSGKSTIGRLISQITPLSSGTITLNGNVLTKRNASHLPVRKQVQMIFQDPYASLNGIHSVRHHIERPLLRHKMCAAADLETHILKLLSDVGLEPPEQFIDKYPHEMSGGQRQRVAIARVLAVQPELIIADEPTSMLDVSVRMEVLALLAELREKMGISLLFITHDLAAARYFSDRIVVLNQGSIVEENTAEALVTTPNSHYTKQLIAAASPGWLSGKFEKHSSEV